MRQSFNVYLPFILRQFVTRAVSTIDICQVTNTHMFSAKISVNTKYKNVYQICICEMSCLISNSVLSSEFRFVQEGIEESNTYCE